LLTKRPSKVFTVLSCHSVRSCKRVATASAATGVLAAQSTSMTWVSASLMAGFMNQLQV
jgi:hypothetical protein